MASLAIPLATPSGLEQIRGALRRNGYTTSEVCTRLRLPRPSSPKGAENGDLRSPWRRAWSEAVARHAEGPPRDGLDVLIRLFDVSAAVSLDDVALAFSEAELHAFDEAELVIVDRASVIPRMRITEVNGLVIVTDTDETAISPITENTNPYAMPAYAETFVFADAVPRDPIGHGLDLCTGSGVHALLMAQHAEHVLATDISERALSIARFNAALNEVDNIAFRQGSILEPASGMRFDRVVCNPPYQPDTDDLGKNWWGGGTRGEDLWIPVVRGLRAHLEPDGDAHLIMQGLSWSADPFVERVGRYADGLTVAWTAFGAPDIEEYRARYRNHGLGELERAEYGLLTLRRPR